MPLVGVLFDAPFLFTSAAIYGQPQGIGPTVFVPVFFFMHFNIICVQKHASLFGRTKNDRLFLFNAGVMVERQWKDPLIRFENIVLHQFEVN